MVRYILGFCERTLFVVYPIYYVLSFIPLFFTSFVIYGIYHLSYYFQYFCHLLYYFHFFRRLSYLL